MDDDLVSGLAGPGGVQPSARRGPRLRRLTSLVRGSRKKAFTDEDIERIEQEHEQELQHQLDMDLVTGVTFPDTNTRWTPFSYPYTLPRQEDADA